MRRRVPMVFPQRFEVKMRLPNVHIVRPWPEYHRPGIAVLTLVVGVGGVGGQLVGVQAAVAVDYAGLVILQKPPVKIFVANPFATLP